MGSFQTHSELSEEAGCPWKQQHSGKFNYEDEQKTVGSVKADGESFRSLINQWLCVQVELGSSEGKAFTLLSQAGGQQAGLRLKLKCFSMSKEISGSMWHSWSWLEDRGIPLNMEVTKLWFKTHSMTTMD